MGERTPLAESLPSAESLLHDAARIIAAEPDPAERAVLYAASLMAGNPAYAESGRAVGSMKNVYNADPGMSSSRWYNRFESIADGMAEVHRRGHAMDIHGSNLTDLAGTILGQHSSVHDVVAAQLLEGGVAGRDGSLLCHYIPESASKELAYVRRGSSAPYGLKQFMYAILSGHNVDIMADGSSYRDISDQILRVEGYDPDFYGYTYYLALAYAKSGNAQRTRELLADLHSPEKHLEPLLYLAESSTDPAVSTAAQQEAVKLAVKTHPLDRDVGLEFAEHFARIGDTERARHWLAKLGEYEHGKAQQADAWAEIYTHDGKTDAQDHCMGFWEDHFNNNEAYLQFARRVAAKDAETGRVAPSFTPTTLPLMAWELTNTCRGDIATYSRLVCAALVEQFARSGNTEAVNAMLDYIRGQTGRNKSDYVRGLTAAAVGLLNPKTP